MRRRPPLLPSPNVLSVSELLRQAELLASQTDNARELVQAQLTEYQRCIHKERECWAVLREKLQEIEIHNMEPEKEEITE